MSGARCLLHMQVRPPRPSMPLAGLPMPTRRASARRRAVDVFGDAALSSNQQGHHYALLRHDPMCATIAEEIKFAHPFNVAVREHAAVLGNVPAILALPAQQQAAESQRIRPDLVWSLAGSATRIGEAKTLNGSTSDFYKRELTGITASTLRDRRGVEGRARTVANQYVARCRLVDGRIAPGIQPGPLESRLLQLGGVQAIVVGNYNEGSSALHELVSDLATQYAERAAHGATPSDHLLSATFNDMVARLSFEFARGRARLLLARVSCVSLAGDVRQQRTQGFAHNQRGRRCRAVGHVCPRRHWPRASAGLDRRNPGANR